MRRIRVAVADDSSFVRRAIVRLLQEHRQIWVVGVAASGEELLANLGVWRPDVITLDLAMPGIGGLATLDRLMITRPTPVIIFSTHSGQGAPQTIEALHRGAVDFIDKQRYSMVDFEALRQVLVEKILQVCSQRPRRGRSPRSAAAENALFAGQVDLLVIGASTGGPPAIQQILEDLGPNLKVPVAVAQHMPEGFTRAFAKRMNAHLSVAVREATDGERLQPGTVYIAPANYHLTFAQDIAGAGLIAQVARTPLDTAHHPSVDLLFSSAARVVGGGTVGVLLTGMGRDGSEGLMDLRQVGAHTIAQDQATSVVYSMPSSAVALGSVCEVLPLGEIGSRLRRMQAQLD